MAGIQKGVELASDGETQFNLFITSPIEPEFVEQIRAVDPDRVTVIFEPAIYPPMQYVADHHGPSGFARTAEQDAIMKIRLLDADFLLDFPSGLPAGKTVLDFAPRLKWVQTTSAGVGQQVVRMGLQGSHLIITTSSGVHARPLAEFVFLALLSHVKELPRLQRDQQAHVWQRFCSDELDGKTMAIVGPGKIGGQVAQIARCFNMRVTVMGRRGGPERAGELGVDAVYTRDQMHEMLGAADVVVLSCPHTPETEGLIDRAAINAIKPGAMFVNIARGQVVDEAALLEALQSGHIAFAGLDVFQKEPLPADSPFWDLPNVMINPHSASTAASENQKITDILCHNLRCYLDGRTAEMHNVLNKGLMY
jgi:phosphoglycerate dehydrogenase-like enzyme